MLIIGLMSGTSGDGLDVALCEISGQPPQLAARIVQAFTIPYTAEQRQRILDVCNPELGRVDMICRLNVELGELFAAGVLRLIQETGIKASDVDLIASHGQTIWHHILPDGRAEATLQIGESCVIAERTGITTISNFRARDIAAGGQGAPLTSYVDWLLLRHPTQWRAVQNIGGMGNVTFLPPLNDTSSTLIAFDTGPGNALIDAAAFHFTGKSYDQDGTLAREGHIDEAWLDGLLQHPYFLRLPPKTTGRELFGTKFALQQVEEGLARKLSPPDIIATLTMLTAISIHQAYREFAPQPIGEVIIGGGGVHNAALMAMLRQLLGDLPVKTHEDFGLSSDFKEALVFAVLAYESWHNRPATLPSQTGAKHPSVLGQITRGARHSLSLQ